MKHQPVIQQNEYMPSGELFAEQRDNWATPYKFNSKFIRRGGELDQETGLYYYGARYYSPYLNIWGSVDPKSDDYPHQSAFMFCSGNPVVRVDMNGMEDEVFITGDQAELAFQDLQASTSLKLERNEDTGEITIIGGEAKNGDDQQLMEAINSTTVSVTLDVNSSSKSYGSFMGTTYSEKSTVNLGDKSTLPSLDISQSVATRNVANYYLLSSFENTEDKWGSGAKHEITEGYQAGLISLQLRRGLEPAIVRETLMTIKGEQKAFYSYVRDYGWYDRAHRAATRAPNE